MTGNSYSSPICLSMPAAIELSAGFTEEAWTRTSTSFGAGVGACRSSRSAGGASNASRATAFIASVLSEFSVADRGGGADEAGVVGAGRAARGRDRRRMIRRAVTAAAAVGLLTVVLAASAPAVDSLPLRLVADVPLPGGSSRFDYQSLDPDRNRLYIPHLAAGEVIVFDVKRRKVSGTIGDLSGIHGVVVAPAIGRVYAAATGTQELVTLDEVSG